MGIGRQHLKALIIGPNLSNTNLFKHMKTFELEGALRADLGKKAAKALRSSEAIPCVLYGGKENVNFTVTQEKLSFPITSTITILQPEPISDIIAATITVAVFFAQFEKILKKGPAKIG